MKDVHQGKPIHKFLGIKSKMHSILLDDGKEFNTAKGVNTAMEFNEYNNILFNKKVTRDKMRRIKSKKHRIGTYEVNKILLSCFDDKGFVLDDDVHKLANFNKDCKNQ